MKGERSIRFPFRRGPIPSDAQLAEATPAAGGDATLASPASPPAVADPPPALTPAPPGTGVAPSLDTSIPDPGPWSEKPPLRLRGRHDDLPEITALRATASRLSTELASIQGSLPGLRDAVSRHRAAVREESIKAKIAGTAEALQVAQAARHQLSRALEAEAAAGGEIEALEVALDRVRADHEQAVARANAAEDALVRAIVNDPARLEAVRSNLIAALDFLHVRAKLTGAGTGNAGHLIAAFLTLALDGSAMWRRSEDLFDKLLAEAKAAKGKGVAA